MISSSLGNGIGFKPTALLVERVVIEVKRSLVRNLKESINGESWLVAVLRLKNWDFCNENFEEWSVINKPRSGKFPLWVEEIMSKREYDRNLKSDLIIIYEKKPRKYL